ncbi:unnamed protein product [Rhizoctonia solani]|uniref:Amine oxidase domain-containing protein n=1 Tax=Rhizoctonia solani TaxID=456999 RepID=A0A8H3BCJ0_9AGAM|nr:unnamed protein product [Rhizoctonia solani]
MMFKRNWWAGQGITRAQSETDHSVRIVVYPSYGGGQSTELIASYCWTQDAATMSSWAQGPKYFVEERLKGIILAELVAIHNIPLKDLETDYQDTPTYDWAHNPNTMGAFAFFDPSQFSLLLTNLTRPTAEGRLHFAGEAISTCRA